MDDGGDLSAGARALIERLELEPHPEGGFFRETFRSDVEIPAGALAPVILGKRALVTSILFLVPAGVHTAWHRFHSEEIWIHQQGDAVELKRHPGLTEAKATVMHLGPGEDQVFQARIPPGWWQTARSLPGEHGHALVACVVSPGFEFEDFELASDSHEWSPPES